MRGTHLGDVGDRTPPGPGHRAVSPKPPPRERDPGEGAHGSAGEKPALPGERRRNGGLAEASQTLHLLEPNLGGNGSVEMKRGNVGLLSAPRKESLTKFIPRACQ